jgi:hypothetical protein
MVLSMQICKYSKRETQSQPIVSGLSGDGPRLFPRQRSRARRATCILLSQGSQENLAADHQNAPES